MRYLVEPTSTLGDFDPKTGRLIPVSELPPAERAWWSLLSRQSQVGTGQLDASPDDRFWQTLAVVDDSPVSQFDALVEASQAGVALPDTLACVALTGSGFHGNRRRPWQALRGNLHFTSFCRRRLEAARCAPALSMLPTLAVTDVLLPLVGERGSIKWVNDVLLGGQKVAGSLVSTQVTGGQIDSFTLGIGLNLETAPRLGNQELAGEPTSLRAAGIALSLPAAFAGLRVALARRIAQLLSPEGPEQLFAAYRQRSRAIGRLVSVYPEAAVSADEVPLATGRLLAIHPDLSLEIEGHAERLCSGRLRLTPELALPD